MDLARCPGAALERERGVEARRHIGGLVGRGIGALKREELARSHSPVALDMMRRIKLALDPDGLMNPQRLI